MKNQTLSIERMRHLRNLGVDTSKATLTWVLYPADIRGGVAPHLTMWRWEQVKDEQKKVCVPSFTLQDIINMLPEEVPCKYARYPLGKACLELGKDYAGYSYTDMNDEHDYDVCFGGHEDILIEVYNLLCWCAENGYLNNSQTK